MCRQCLVEVEGPRGPMMVVSCMTPVAEGQVVRTATPRRQAGPGGRARAAARQPPARLPGVRQGRRVPAAGPGVHPRPRREPLRRGEAPLREADPDQRPRLPRPRALHPLRPLHPLRRRGRRRPADQLHPPRQRDAGAHVPRRAVRVLLLRQHGADLPGRCADRRAVPVQGPAVGPRAGREHVHDVLGRLPHRRAVEPRRAGALPRRRLRPRQLELAVRPRPLQLRGRQRRRPPRARRSCAARAGWPRRRGTSPWRPPPSSSARRSTAAVPAASPCSAERGARTRTPSRGPRWPTPSACTHRDAQLGDGLPGRAARAAPGDDRRGGRGDARSCSSGPTSRRSCRSSTCACATPPSSARIKILELGPSATGLTPLRLAQRPRRGRRRRAAAGGPRRPRGRRPAAPPGRSSSSPAGPTSPSRPALGAAALARRARRLPGRQGAAGAAPRQRRRRPAARAWPARRRPRRRRDPHRRRRGAHRPASCCSAPTRSPTAPTPTWPGGPSPGPGAIIAVDTFLTESSPPADVVLAAAAFGEKAARRRTSRAGSRPSAGRSPSAGTARPDWMIAAELAERARPRRRRRRAVVGRRRSPTPSPPPCPPTPAPRRPRCRRPRRRARRARRRRCTVDRRRRPSAADRDQLRLSARGAHAQLYDRAVGTAHSPSLAPLADAQRGARQPARPRPPRRRRRRPRCASSAPAGHASCCRVVADERVPRGSLRVPFNVAGRVDRRHHRRHRRRPSTCGWSACECSPSTRCSTATCCGRRSSSGAVKVARDLRHRPRRRRCSWSGSSARSSPACRTASGPNKAGPFGILQTLADGMKLIFKEDFLPDRADRWVYRLAPFLAFVPAFLVWSVIPLGGDFSDGNDGIVTWFGARHAGAARRPADRHPARAGAVVDRRLRDHARRLVERLEVPAARCGPGVGADGQLRGRARAERRRRAAVGGHAVDGRHRRRAGHAVATGTSSPPASCRSSSS